MANYWHVAFAVPDLDAAMAEFGAALDLTWRPVRVVPMTMHDSTGALVEMDVKVTFTQVGNPAIEMFEAIPDSPLAAQGGSVFHHMGYWCDSLEAETARLESVGWPSHGASPDDGSHFPVRLFKGPLGVILEPCDVHDFRPSLRDLYPPGSPHAGPVEPDPDEI
jgi:hypothetical protein